MKSFAILIVTSLLAGCSWMKNSSNPSEGPDFDHAAAAKPSAVALNAPEQFLIDAAAKDFHFHRPPFPGAFRHVRVGRFRTAEGAEQSIMCGEFLAMRKNSESAWMYFATIKTSDYDQLIGLQAPEQCQLASIVWGEHADLSAELQRRLDLQGAQR